MVVKIGNESTFARAHGIKILSKWQFSSSVGQKIWFFWKQTSVRFIHCNYLRLNSDQIAAYGRTTTAIPWPLVVGCQSIFMVDIGIKEKYRKEY